MASEIERKFLVRDETWENGVAGLRLIQGYLSLDPDRTVRVRIADDLGWLTIKGRTVGIMRQEFEYSIPPEDAKAMLELCLPTVIDKTRYRVPFGGHVWEIDVFHGENAGLVMAEVELADESTELELPPWVGDEVSADSRYFNACLAAAPFGKWKKSRTIRES